MPEDASWYVWDYIKISPKVAIMHFNFGSHFYVNLHWLLGSIIPCSRERDQNLFVWKDAN